MKKITCLLIDDDPEELEIFSYALEELDRPVKHYSARTGREALAFLLEGHPRPDYIFLDMNMPRMDGKQCLTAIRKLGPAGDIPVILYSTSFVDPQKAALRAMGASGFLTKTSTVTELTESLENIFQSGHLYSRKLAAVTN